MFCNNCGKEIDNSAVFCPYCGKSVNVTAAPEQPEKPHEKELKENKSKEKKPKSKKSKAIKIIAICCAVILAITGTVGGLYWYKNRKQPLTSDENYVYFDSCFTDIKITDEQSALDAINDVKSALNITDVYSELQSCAVDKFDDAAYYRFQQYYNDIPVYGRNVIVSADAEGNATALTSNYKSIDISTKKYGKDDNVVIYGENDNICTISYASTDTEIYKVFTDVKSGKEVGRLCLTYAADPDYAYKQDDGKYLLYDQAKNIQVFNANGNLVKKDFKEIENYKYKINIYTDRNKNIISENTTVYDKSGLNEVDFSISGKIEKLTSKKADGFDGEAVKAMRNAQDAYWYYGEKLQRKGYDNHSSKLYLIYNDENDNAYSYCSLLISLGEKYNDLDVVAHEFTHSVERTISSMKYCGESGAIMEGYSDVMGELAEAYVMSQKYGGSADPDWIMNPTNVNRNISSPVSVSLPAKYKGENWKTTVDNVNEKGETTNDHGYVHNNSTVISHAAYFMWNGGETGSENSAWKIDTDKLATLWYRTLFILQQDTTFNQLALAMNITAKTMYDSGLLTKDQLVCVKKAFENAGITSADSQNIKMNAANGSKVIVKGVNYEDLPSYYIKLTDSKSKVVAEGTYTSDSPYVIDVKDNGIYNLTVKESSNATAQFEVPVRIIKINRKSDFVIYTNFVSNSQTSPQPPSNSTDTLTPTDKDFEMFEKMLNWTSDYVWSTNKTIDFDSISNSKQIYSFITGFGHITLYDYYWGEAWSRSEDDYGTWYGLDADKVDWIIKNVFCGNPDRTAKSNGFYYKDNKFYTFEEYGGGPTGMFKIVDKCKLDDGKYGLSVKYYFMDEELEPYYFIVSLHSDDTVGNYWRIHTFSNEKIFQTNSNGNTTPTNSKEKIIPSNAVEFNGHKYFLFDDDAVKTYSQALKFCDDRGGHLATITSKEENDFLYSYITGLGVQSAYFGLSDAQNEGEWAWCNGEKFSYSNWHQGEPNSENSNEDYAMFYYKFSDGTWNDGDFDVRTVNGGVAFICEWD